MVLRRRAGGANCPAQLSARLRASARLTAGGGHRDRTRSLLPAVRNLTLRLAAERIFRSNYEPLRDLP